MDEHTREEKPADSRPWVKPELKPIGQVDKVLQGGGGKLSVTAQDSGDIRKPQGQS